MWPRLVFCILLILVPVAIVVAQEGGSKPATDPSAMMDTAMNGKGGTDPLLPAGSSDPAGEAEAKMVTGMSVLGNKEAPMSLFIVPWKSSELGAETNLTRTLNERQVPVDREVFDREIAFYEVGAGSPSPPPRQAPGAP